MPGTKSSYRAQGTTDGAGACTISFRDVPVGWTDTGSVYVIGLDALANVTGAVGDIQLPSWNGQTVCHDVQVIGNGPNLVLQITFAAPNTTYTAQFSGTRSNTNTTPPTAPSVDAQTVSTQVPSGVLVFDTTIGPGQTYIDTVLPDLPSIYHSLEFAVDPVDSGTVIIRLYDLTNGVQMWRYNLSALSTSEVNPVYFNVIPTGQGIMGIEITVDNATAGNVKVAMWAAPDELAVASTGGPTGPSNPVVISPVPLPVLTVGAAAAASYGQTSVGTSATAIAGTRTDRTGLTIKLAQSASASVYLGTDNAVTTANGYLLEPGNSVTTADPGQVYGIVATGTQTVFWEDE
jgi:hypothetical protein